MNWHLRKYVWRLLPGTLTAVAIALLLRLNAFQSLEQITYYQLFNLCGSKALDDRLAIIAVDDASLQQLGRFPLSRRYYTQLFNILAKAEAEPSVVVVNLIWSEPSPEDTQLAEAMAKQGHVVLAQAWDKTGALLMPVPELAAAAIATGHVLKQEDADGLVRQVNLQVAGQPALSVAALQVYGLTQQLVALPDLDRPLWLNWTGPMANFRAYSLVDVLKGQVPAQTFRNKIILLGVTATGLDPLVTPFNRNPPSSGLHLHATVIQNLLQHNALQPLQGKELWLGILLSAPGLSWLMSGWSTRQQLIAIVGLCCGWGFLSIILFRANYWLPTAAPIAVFITTAVTFAISDRFREDYLLRQQVTRLWQYYRQDLIIDAIESDPALLLTQKPQLQQPQDAVSRVAQLAALAEQLGRSQSMQIAIARTLSIGLLAAEFDGSVWFCNPVAGSTLQVEVGTNLSASMVPGWLSLEQWRATMACLKAGTSVKHDNLQQGDRWYDLIFQPLIYRTLNKNTEGPVRPDSFLLMLEEITEWKQVEVELQTAKEVAIREAARSEKANRAKSKFLAHMSHELRTPLNAILGFTQVMSHDQTLAPEHQNYLKIINRSGQHLLELINDVLEMSKIEAGRIRLNPTRFDLYHLLNHLEAMLQIKASAKQLTLAVECAPDLPRYIQTDEGKLRQVLLNLVGNAIKFTERGRVTLRVKVDDLQSGQISHPGQEPSSPALDVTQATDRNHPEPGDVPPLDPSIPLITLIFEVEDTGPGIAPEEIGQLFQPFSQARAGQQTNEGTGLGLAISRKFVQLMGGEITVQSVLSQGSLFKFHIQVGRAAAEAIPAATPKHVIALAPGQPTYRILIVEDKKENSEFLVKLLVPLGFEVRVAANGQMGVSLWEQWHPQLVLMDIRMPVMDGVEATCRIRRIERDRQLHQANRANSGRPSESFSPTKIIALTASVFEETKADAVAIGCDDFLSKPVEENTLLLKLAEHLGVRYLYSQSERGDLRNSQVETAFTLRDLAADLMQMPTDWVQQMYQFALIGSDDPIRQLIEQIPEAQASLAEALTNWVENFQFDEIIHLVQVAQSGLM